MDTSVSDDKWGTLHHCIFIVTTLITDVLFEQFFICTTVLRGDMADKEL